MGMLDSQLAAEAWVYLEPWYAPGEGEYLHPSRTLSARFHDALLFELACLRLRHHNCIRIITLMQQYFDAMANEDLCNEDVEDFKPAEGTGGGLH